MVFPNQGVVNRADEFPIVVHIIISRASPHAGKNNFRAGDSSSDAAATEGARVPGDIACVANPLGNGQGLTGAGIQIEDSGAAAVRIGGARGVGPSDD